MPWWVAQKTGPLVDEIQSVLDEYHGTDYGPAAQEVAYRKMRAIYRRERPDGSDPGPYEQRADNGQGGVMSLDSMIRHWFPTYINMPWSDGTGYEAEQEADWLENRYPGTVYETCWEY